MTSGTTGGSVSPGRPTTALTELCYGGLCNDLWLLARSASGLTAACASVEIISEGESELKLAPQPENNRKPNWTRTRHLSPAEAGLTTAGTHHRGDLLRL